MDDTTAPKPVELLKLSLSPRAEQMLQQITEVHGITVGDVVELAISTGLPSVVREAARISTK
jgi:hypothetical protein